MEEYSYPLAAGYPVAKLLKQGGLLHPADAVHNVAVALTGRDQRQPWDPNHLTQKLDKVYVNPDKRTYPLSSYVYAIIPTAADDSKMTTPSARRSPTSSTRCAWARSAIGPIGYSPLPINLVQASPHPGQQAEEGRPRWSSTPRSSERQNCWPDLRPRQAVGELPGEDRAHHPAECDRPGQPMRRRVGTFNDNPEARAASPAPGTGNASATRVPPRGRRPGSASWPPPTPTATGPDRAAAGGDVPVGGGGSTTGTTDDTVNVVATTLDPRRPLRSPERSSARSCWASSSRPDRAAGRRPGRRLLRRRTP